MPESFDPYRVWLSIPPESRPPTHYQLLGVSPDEHDPTVINAAVMRQSAYVRNYQVGKYAEQAAQILNEVQAAKACLLDPAKRARYDAGLPAGEAAAARQRYGVPTAAFPRSALPAIGLSELVGPSDPPHGDLLAMSSSQAEPVAVLRSSRGRKPVGSWRGLSKSKYRALIWQLPAAFWFGVVITLAVVAIWPRPVQQMPSDAETTPSRGSTAKAEPATFDVTAGHTDNGAPQILESKTDTLFITNSARIEDDSFFVGLSNSHGHAAVGYELDRIDRLVLEVQVTGPLRRIDDGAFAGFIIDYHTAAGYSKRVALAIGPFDEQWRRSTPGRWGKRSAPDRVVDLSRTFAFDERKYLEQRPDLADAIRLGRMTTADLLPHWQRHGRYEGSRAFFGSMVRHEFHLPDWAPPDWDGRSWFSVVMQNSGAGAGVEGRLIEPSPFTHERLPGEFRRLTGHTDSVTSLAFLPNGRLVSGSFDTTWAIWEVNTGIGVRRFGSPAPGRENAVRALAIRPDGSTVLLSNGDSIACIDPNNGNVLKWLDGHRWAIWCLAFSPDGRRALSGSGDSQVRLWDVEAGNLLWERSLASCVFGIAFARDGRLAVATSHSDKEDPVRVFEVATGNQIRSLPAGNLAVIGTSIAPDGRRCLTSGNPIRLWDLESGAEMAQFPEARGAGSKPVFSADRRFAAWGGDDEFVSLWDIENRTLIAEFEHATLGQPKHRRHSQDWMPVAFSPDGKLLASGGDDGTIYLWHVPPFPDDEAKVDDATSAAAERGQFTPLDLSGVANVVSTRGMFHGEDTDERLILDDWSPKIFEGVPFQLVDPQGDRVANIVMLYSPGGQIPPRMPPSVTLPCHSSARAIHFLSGVSGWGAQSEIKGGSVSMVVRLHYRDGTTEEHPLRNGEHFADYNLSDAGSDVPRSKRAFTFRGGHQMRYFAIRPKHRETIEAIELAKGPDYTAPLVMAITLEGP
ncbi:MAG TPA: WD40 repeat domain-containing protein [Pirellulales bacterium]|nr:WD40 repeat domain-containing protein [Pirellulales bacterium]